MIIEPVEVNPPPPVDTCTRVPAELLYVMAQAMERMAFRGVIVDPDRIKVEVKKPERLETYFDLKKRDQQVLSFIRDFKFP